MADINKITKKDNYMELRAIVDHTFIDGNKVKDRLIAFIDRELMLMEQRAEKQKKYQKKHDAAHDELSAQITNVLLSSEVPLTLRDIANKIEGSTPQKLTYRLSKMYDIGDIIKATVTVDTPNGKRRATTYMAATD